MAAYGLLTSIVIMTVTVCLLQSSSTFYHSRTQMADVKKASTSLTPIQRQVKGTAAYSSAFSSSSSSYPPVSVPIPIAPPQPRPTPALPLSRVFLLYIPLIKENPHSQVDEVFGFIESWRFLYGRREEEGVEPKVPTSQLHVLHGDTFNAYLAFPEGVPYINDVIMVVDPRIDEDVFPWICRVAYADDAHLWSVANVNRRIQLAEKFYGQDRGHGQAKWREEDMTIDPATTSSLGQAGGPTSGQSPLRPSSLLSRCYVIKTFLSFTQFQDDWRKHPAMHSVAALADPAVASLVSQYDLVMRSDNDCFLAPFLNHPKYVPWLQASSPPNEQDTTKPPTSTHIQDLEQSMQTKQQVRENITGNEMQEPVNNVKGGEQVSNLSNRSEGGAWPDSVTVAPSANQYFAESTYAAERNLSTQSSYAFFVGGGGYGSFTVSRLLPEYSRLLGLRHQGIRGIGSTWYGRPIDVLQAARLTVQVGDYLIKNDPVFIRGGGEWPEWCLCVLLLYSGEIALNHVVEKHLLYVRPNLLDSQSTSSKLMLLPLQRQRGENPLTHQLASETSDNLELVKDELSPDEHMPAGGVDTSPPMGSETKQLHIHCWHTSNFFSKHAFKSNKYTSRMFEDEAFNILAVKYYSFANSWNGQHRRILQQEMLANASLPTSLPFVSAADSKLSDMLEKLDLTANDVPLFLSPLMTQLLSDFFLCPESHPLPYSPGGNMGSACCKELSDCRLQPLTKDSDCCSNHRFQTCRSAPCRVNIIGLQKLAKVQLNDDTDKMNLVFYLSTLTALETKRILESKNLDVVEDAALLQVFSRIAKVNENESGGSTTSDAALHDPDECPMHHPYPYTPENEKSASYCCRLDIDCTSVVLLGPNSSCCFEHQNVPCQVAPCEPHRSVHAKLTEQGRYGFTVMNTPQPRGNKTSRFVKKFKNTLKALGFMRRNQ